MTEAKSLLREPRFCGMNVIGIHKKLRGFDKEYFKGDTIFFIKNDNGKYHSIIEAQVVNHVTYDGMEAILCIIRTHIEDYLTTVYCHCDIVAPTEYEMELTILKLNKSIIERNKALIKAREEVFKIREQHKNEAIKALSQKLDKKD